MNKNRKPPHLQLLRRTLMMVSPPIAGMSLRKIKIPSTRRKERHTSSPLLSPPLVNMKMKSNMSTFLVFITPLLGHGAQ
ncbi:hypothetical protein DSO57_1039741 [Entomophthora muscae]|uniref:Uncharacterized protein n=1 Tax=Entomophthora muscae TaxID=34485 RepID=A0ACC2URX4_9FUNG|nr:hypothetical protein DSO57_1039741 [Entomophthora muscae]